MNPNSIRPAGMFSACLLVLSGGCQVDEVRSTNEFAVEWRHKGETNTNYERYMVKPGVELQWSNDVKTGVSYRRRDDDHGPGDNDNGMFFDFTIPLWRRPKERDPNELRIIELERRLAALEARAGEPASPSEPSGAQADTGADRDGS
jgi:hypothetical protein